jgi:hypothetical protein
MQNPKYVKLPIDISKVKRVWFMGLTKQHWKGGVYGILTGIIPFFITLYFVGVFAAAIILFIIAAPVTFFFVYENNGVNFKERLLFIMRFRKKPRKRTYKSRNLAEYAELEREKLLLERSLKNGYVYKEEKRVIR